MKINNILYYKMHDLADIFGKPNEGPHSIRLFGIAIVDLVLTIIGAFFLSKLLKVNFFIVLLLLLLLGILLHRIFRVNTTINKLIFGEL
jgi:hypothetical protein